MIVINNIMFDILMKFDVFEAILCMSVEVGKRPSVFGDFSLEEMS